VVLDHPGLVQLGRRQSRIGHLHAVYNRYMEVISEIPFIRPIPVDTSAGEVPLYFESLCDERDRLVDFLNSQSIQVRPFTPCLHTSSYLGGDGDYPNSVMFEDRGLFLPCGPTQPLENIDRVVDALAHYAKQRTVVSL